ncbi:hypothetical protein E3N88_37777 [Mikania micrantha]|uniref:Leucine-rich repeat-containing N-terminal plant-type domain-containing protein n=1 Tax=Mikania micrantha TaxID=192012 RepID=A0A5N6LSB2_9ASTR|nr:hypothetical protein E3N88_37777 [Mikania micrantha]
METSFVFIFTFLLMQRFGSSITATSSNVTCIEGERRSLLAIKHKITDRYNLLSTWSGVECCEWRGVGCDTRNGHVVKLDLRSLVSWDEKKWLVGKLSPWLQNLKHLRYLDLSMNHFSGKIPEFLGSFERLIYLNLSGSGFSEGVVPHHLGNLSRYLDLSGIAISDHTDWFHPLNLLPSLLTLNLASSLYMIHKTPSLKSENFTSLNSLDLSMNDINSTIPLWLSNLTSLMHLNLHDNNFHGKIPDFIGMFSPLASIDLASNAFEILMPDLLCNLSSLVHLDLSYNKFYGPVPSNLGLLSRLEYLNLGYNKLSGNIPMVSNLVRLDLSTLNFSSRWIPPFQLQIFSASSCNIGPSFPNWLRTQKHLQSLQLSNSSIKGTLPEWFESILSDILYLDLSNNQIGGKMPLVHFDTSDQRLYETSLKMNSNKFEGTIAAFPSNVNLLDLSDNLLSGELPQTDGSTNLNLNVVNLSKNRFTGNIPIDLCRVRGIQVLNLSQNKLSGRLPECLGNMSSLESMDLSNNTITGLVPSSLGSLTGLVTLHLHNNILEGNLPLSLQHLTRLITMDIGYNFLVGDIPFWIGERLINLAILNLQSNKFTGKIPLHFCQLNSLMHLNLAQNNIIGTIPACFANLSGMITDQGNTVYDTYYYEENILASMKGIQLVYTKTIKLCGPPLSRSCKGDNSSYEHVSKVEAQNDDEEFWLYAGMGAGFVFGFVGLLGSLHFIRRWRVAYFEMLEKFYTSILVNLACLWRTCVS